MQRRELSSLCVLLAAASLSCGQARRIDYRVSATTPVGFVMEAPPRPLGDRPQLRPYQPQPGDIVLYDDYNRLFHIAFMLARTGPPTHTAIVIEGTDGKPALLELTGPRTLTAKVCIMDVGTRFRSYPGDIWVRRIHKPLTPAQSHELTQFALAQQGKSFAIGRVLLHGSPFCPRTGLRQALFGHTYTNRRRWFCSELVVAACARAGVLDGRTCCANSTFPRDLTSDDRMPLSKHYGPPVPWNAGYLSP
ncbi:MAG: hypothetical protein HYX68_08365 [Planctomycetes bacterium]|nr:hypothetical protein [Planctomycetota bacterium]